MKIQLENEEMSSLLHKILILSSNKVYSTIVKNILIYFYSILYTSPPISSTSTSKTKRNTIKNTLKSLYIKILLSNTHTWKSNQVFHIVKQLLSDLDSEFKLEFDKRITNETSLFLSSLVNSLTQNKLKDLIDLIYKSFNSNVSYRLLLLISNYIMSIKRMRLVNILYLINEYMNKFKNDCIYNNVLLNSYSYNKNNNYYYPQCQYSNWSQLNSFYFPIQVSVSFPIAPMTMKQYKK